MTGTTFTLPPIDTAVLAQLVGIPYVARGRTMTGCDCWGLMRLAAERLWGYSYPEYFYTHTELLHDAADLIAHETANDARWCEVRDPYPRGAIHIFRINGYKTHCGLHLDGRMFLHSLPGRNSCLETLDDINWQQRRTGTYVLR